MQSTIGEFASISDKEVVSRFFLNTVQKLLKVTQEAGKPGNSRTSNSIPTNPLTNDSSPSLLRCSFSFPFSVIFLQVGYRHDSSWSYESFLTILLSWF